jgi:hypothetical protein
MYNNLIIILFYRLPGGRGHKAVLDTRGFWDGAISGYGIL